MADNTRGKKTPRKTPAKTPKKQPKRPTDPVEVYCRLKPVPDTDEDVCATKMSTAVLELDPPEFSQLYKAGHRNPTQYTFQHVFDTESEQKEVFDRLCVPMVEDVLRGKNGLLFAFGITGSGKTYTMTGEPGNGGMLPRSLDVIFNSIANFQSERFVFKPDQLNGFGIQSEFNAKMEQQRYKASLQSKTGRGTDSPDFIRIPDTMTISDLDEDNAYGVFVSFIEIYNNYIYDLLEETDSDDLHPKPPQSKILREDPNHWMFVSGAMEIEVKSTEEAYELLWRGQRRRRVAQTQLNHESSRSHSVFTIRVVAAPLDSSGAEIITDKAVMTVSQLALVDLAGSERTSRTRATGDRLREAGNINANLMVLRTCMETLRENQITGTTKIVPYRDSKLTHMFKNYFDGEGKVRMVVCISPRSDDYDETVHVMKFAELAQEVQVTRPTVKRVDFGLTPGRRNVQKLYREAIDQLEEMKRGVDENTAPAVVATAPSIGQIPMTFSFPMITAPELVSCDDEVTLMAFVQSLREKQEERQHFLEDFSAKHRQFRDMLTRVDGGYRELHQALSEANEAIAAKDREIQKMERRIRTAEKKAHQDALTQERQQWEQETEKKLAGLRREMEEKIWRKEEKLRQLKEIVQQQSKKPSAQESGIPTHANDMRQVPAVRARNRKRSLSADTWLEHKPISHLRTDTVLQPQLKRKKTVSTPKLKHLREKSGGCPKYVLTHQEQDSQGEVETHLFKGDVWKTRGGGAAVQFTDVETLKSENPITPEGKESRRHSAPPSASSESELSIDCASDSTDVGTKCGYGIEGRAGSVPGYTNAYTGRSPGMKSK